MLTYLIYVCSLLSVGDGGAGSGRLAVKAAPARDSGGGEVRTSRSEPSEVEMPRIAPKGRISVGMSHGISFQH
jgi:hypothetical protein